MCGKFKFASVRPKRGEQLALLAWDKQPDANEVAPMRPVPLVISPTACEVARWGWPNPRGGILTHARTETAHELPTWRKAWQDARGVVPVAGWLEGSWQVDAPGACLAVLWTGPADDRRFVVLTQDPGAHGVRIERFPVPLSEAGALVWLAGGGLEDQVSVQVRGAGGQLSIFDEEPPG